jgi:hypothetical protein
MMALQCARAGIISLVMVCDDIDPVMPDPGATPHQRRTTRQLVAI